MGEIMQRKTNTAKQYKEEPRFEEAEPLDQDWQDRTLVLRKEPPPRKMQLMAAGVKEIRCVACIRIRPIAGAEEFGDGWICEDCLSDAMEEQRCAG